MSFPPGAEPAPSGSNGSRGRGSRMFGGRGILISSASTIVFFAVIALAVALAPGSSLVAERFFDPYHLNRSLFGTVTTPSVVGAFVLNIKMFLIAEVFILILALVVAIVRGIPGPVFFPFRAIAVGYTDLFRGVPLILVLYMIGFGLPGLGLKFFSSQSEVTYGVVALVLVYSAYVAEVYRAGIDSVHESQTAAARSLGLSRWQAMRFVVLPQAVRRVIPPLLNDFIGLQKDTVLVSFIGVVEVFRQSQIRQSATFNFTPYLVTALVFLLVTIPLARITDWLVSRERDRRYATAVRSAGRAG